MRTAAREDHLHAGERTAAREDHLHAGDSMTSCTRAGTVPSWKCKVSTSPVVTEETDEIGSSVED